MFVLDQELFVINQCVYDDSGVSDVFGLIIEQRRGGEEGIVSLFNSLIYSLISQQPKMIDGVNFLVRL